MALYCPTCVAYVSPGTSECHKCGTSTLCCSECRTYRPVGSTRCDCSSGASTLPVSTIVRAEVVGSMELVPAQAGVGFVPDVVPVPERYDAGRYGIEAVVTIPAVDVAIMNELGKLVQLLHAMATRLNQFTGMTDRTRKLIRDMRVLATDVQEEIESRRGPL